MPTLRKHRRPLRYFCIDVEASGQVPGLYNMLSIGCTVVDDAEGGALVPGESFYVELQPVFDGIDPDAVAVCGLDVEQLRREGTEPKQAMANLDRWVRGHAPEGTRAVFVGHNAPFDWMMIAYYFAWAGMENPFGYSAIDTKALAMGVFGLPWPDTSKRVLPALLGIAEDDQEQKHRADYDAHYQAEIFCALMRVHRERGDAREQAR